MSNPQRRTQTISRGMMKPRNKTSPSREDQHLLNWRLATQIERLVDKSFDRSPRFDLRSSRCYLEFEILILPPHPRLSVNTASTRRKAIHCAFRSCIKTIHFGRIVEVENQREVLR